MYRTFIFSLGGAMFAIGSYNLWWAYRSPQVLAQIVHLLAAVFFLLGVVILFESFRVSRLEDFVRAAVKTTLKEISSKEVARLEKEIESLRWIVMVMIAVIGIIGALWAAHWPA